MHVNHNAVGLRATVGMQWPWRCFVSLNMGRCAESIIPFAATRSRHFARRFSNTCARRLLVRWLETRRTTGS